MTSSGGPDEFQALASRWLAQQRSANTRAAYQADLDRFSAWCEGAGQRPLHVGPEHVEQYREACEAEGAGTATVARRLSSLSSFFTFAAGACAVSSSPVQGATRPPPPPSPTPELTADELDALVAAAARQGPKTNALVSLLLYDGLKLSEILAADVEHLGEGDDGPHLDVTRRSRPQRIPLDVRTTDAIGAYLAGRDRGPLLLGQSPTRGPARLTRFGADYLLRRASEGAGLARQVSANGIRRSHVQLARDDGRSLRSIQDHLGHADIRTTRRHLRADPPGGA